MPTVYSKLSVEAINETSEMFNLYYIALLLNQVTEEGYKQFVY